MENNSLLNERYLSELNEQCIFGEGFFGTLYYGYDVKTNITVFINKLQQEELENDPDKMNSLTEEINMLKKCECPHSLKLIDYFNENSFTYIIFEEYDSNLKTELQKTNHSFSISQIRTILHQLNDTFHIMIKNNIIHKNLTLENILIKYTNAEKTQFNVKLSGYTYHTDINLNKELLPPEILQDKRYTNLIDIWKLGIVIYQMYYNILPCISNIIINPKESTSNQMKQDEKYLIDLMNQMLQPIATKRIRWDSYFKHPFFNKNNNVKVSSKSLTSIICSLMGQLRSTKDINLKQINDKQGKVFIPETTVEHIKQSKDYFTYLKYNVPLILPNGKVIKNNISRAQLETKNDDYVMLIVSETNIPIIVQKFSLLKSLQKQEKNLLVYDYKNCEHKIEKQKIIKIQKFTSAEYYEWNPVKTNTNNIPLTPRKNLLNNRYKLNIIKENFLGQGAFGTVYKGYDYETQTFVAIKRLEKFRIEKDQYFKNALQKEIEILKLCKCPYSLHFIDYFSFKEYIYIVCELCDTNLSNVLQQRKSSFSVLEIKKILTQLNQVFHIMNVNNIIHRDLKLDNILVKYTNSNKTEFDVKLGDFGVSTINDSLFAQTQIGTVLTMAPEILRGEIYTKTADLWSLGVIIYQMHFNQYPFIANSQIQILNLIEKTKPRFTPKDSKLADLLKKMLKSNQQERINWENYFQHPFFNDQQLNVHVNKKEEKKEKKITNIDNNINTSQMGFQIKQRIHSFSKVDYSCHRIKDLQNKKTYIAKVFSNSFIEEHKIVFEKEKEIIKKLNNANIASIVYSQEYKEQRTTILLFENKKGMLLSEFIKNTTITEEKIYQIINSLIKKIFVPMNKLGVVLDIITPNSIFINTENLTTSLFDCGLQKLLYTPEQINEYFLFPEEFDVVNEKTNVLNFGITIFKVFYKINPIINELSNEISFPLKTKSSEEFKQFLKLTLNKDYNQRANWEELLNSPYITSPLQQPSQLKTLFSVTMIEHIINSFQTKILTINDFLQSDIYQIMEIESIQSTCLFLFSVVADLTYAIETFENFIQKKVDVSNIITVFNMNKDKFIDGKHLDLALIPLNKRFCKQEVEKLLTKIKTELKTLKVCILQHFMKESGKCGKNYSQMKLGELMTESLNQLKEGILWVYIDNLFDSINKDSPCYLYIKYVLEYTIVLYELGVHKQKTIKNNFYDINDTYLQEVKNKKKQIDVAKSTVFTSFLKNGFVKCQDIIDENKYNQYKEDFVTYNTAFTGFYFQNFKEN